MGYYLIESAVSPKEYCEKCLQAIAVTALTLYQSTFGGDEVKQVYVIVLRKVAIVYASKVVEYSWEELGFADAC